MVLDDASPQSAPSTSTSAYEYTPTDGSSPWTKYYPLQIKPELITHPDLFTLYFGFFGKWNWKRKFTTNLTQRIENARVLVQRPPTQDELDAFVEHTSRSVYNQRLGAPLGFLIGSARLLAQARKSEKFPLYLPSGANPSLGGFTPAQLVEAGRNFLRTDPGLAKQMAKLAGFKLFLWTLSGSAFSSVYAVWVDTTSTMTDTRLKGFVDDVRKQNPEEVRKRKMEAAAERGRSRRERRQEVASSIEEGGHNGQEDVSYYGDAQQQEGQDRSQNGYTATSSPSPSEQGLYGGLGNTRQSPTVSPVVIEDRSRGAGFFDDEDDASPTAPEYRNTGRQQDSVYVAGSAWERIRQQNQGQSRSSVQSNILQPSLSQRPQLEIDGQSERDQAQADFDRLLESERNLPNDTGDGGQRRGWGRWN